MWPMHSEKVHKKEHKKSQFFTENIRGKERTIQEISSLANAQDAPSLPR